MESDERFKHLATDPRFKTLRRKQQKVKIDERFQSMFTDKKFTLKYSKDKRGRNQKKTSGDDLKRYYSIDEKEESSTKTSKLKVTEEEQDEEQHDIKEDSNDESDHSEQNENHDDDEDEEPTFKDQTDSATDTELSSSSDETDSDVDNPDEADIDPNDIKYDWQPLDHDAEKTETATKRLAIQNLDWDHLDIRDIYTLVNSIRPPLNVRLYVSEFGKERLAKEDLHGPQEIIENSKDDEIEEEYNQLKDKMRRLKHQEVKSYRVNEYEDADEQMDPKNEEIRERVRRYQLNRMKYYYAVAEFASVDLAELVYKELDGMEYEGSSLELDLRFVPEDMEFDPADIKAECDKVPDVASYKAPQFINTALQQTSCKFTWDETDTKRQDKLRRAYTKEELERDDLEAYLASETDSEDNEDEDGVTGDAVSVVTANSEVRANKYKMLLKSLNEEEKKKLDVDVDWSNSSGDEQLIDARDEVNSDSESFPDDSDDPVSEEPSEPKLPLKKRAKKSKRKRKPNQDEEDKELDLLVMDNNDKTIEDFKFNPDDERFKAVYESGAYNIDPSHPKFKRTDAFDEIAKRKRQRKSKN